MNAAPGATNTYTVTYDGTTNKFTIARATGSNALVLKFGDGANLTRSIHLDLGYTSTNKTGSTSYLADSVAYKSREWVTIALLVAATGALGCALNHNLSANGTATLLGNASDSWAAPTLTQVLSDLTSDPLPLRLKFFTGASFAFWRLVLVDVQNNVGYTELGVFHVSNYIEPGYDFTTPWSERRDEMSTVSFADQGASYVDEKPTRKTWPLRWPALTPGEKTNFDLWLNFVRVGKPFFFAFEPTLTPSFTRYVMVTKDPIWARVPPDYWTLEAELAAVLA
jgi:hypothetical protein